MQFVGYRTDDPALLVSDGANAADADGSAGSAVERVALVPGRELAYTLGERHCAGVVRDGRHAACDEPRAPYCDAHTSTWACARCTGGCDLPLPSCREEHAVYLAAFAPDVFKVGVTRSWRLERRLREQGADRAAHLRTVPDGRRARRIESALARDFTDRVRVPTKRSGLHLSVDEGAWESALVGFDVRERFDFEDGLDLTDRPMAETLATGTVRGTKGRLLVLDHGGSTYAVDLRDLVGYEVTAGRTGRDLQSSLGAFG